MAIDRNKVAQQAERLVLQGKLAEAVVQYELLIKDNARDMNTVNKLGDLYSRLGKKREAILQFSKIGDFYAKDGFFLKAIAIYKKITKLDPGHLDAYQRLADLYAQQGLILEARSQYQMVAEQYLKANDVRKAISAYQALVRVDPENLKHRGHLADLLAQNGSPAEAAEEYARVGAELERKGQHGEARAMYQKGSTIQPGSPAVLARLAHAQAASGDIDGGIKMVKDALRKPGDHKELLSMLGDFYLKAGKHQEAEAAFNQAIEAAPENAELKLKLATTQIERGDASGAYNTLAPHFAALSKENRGRETAALLERITQLDGQHLDSHMKLAEIYAAHKREPDFSRCAKQVIKICMDRSDNALGRRHATVLLKLRPDDKFLREKLAQLRAAEPPGEGTPPSSRPAPARTPDKELSEAAASVEMSAPEPVQGGLRDDIASLLDLPAAPKLEPEDEDFITEHMTEAEVFVKYGLADRAVEQLSAVLERFPGYVPAIMKLKEIHLEDGNREAIREQMVGLIKAHLAAEDASAADEAFAELKRFDPNCSEVAMLGSTMFTTSAPAAGQMAHAAMSGAAEMTEMAEPMDLDSDEEEEETIVVESETDERDPTSEELQEVDRFLGRQQREEAVAVLRRLVLDCGSHPEIVSRMKSAMAMRPVSQSGNEAQTARPAGEPDELELILEPASEDFEPEPAPQPTPLASSHAAPAAHVPTTNDVSRDISDLSDLASEIDAALMGDTAQNDSLLAGIEATPEGHSLEEIVQAFKKGIEQQVSADDFDTHYNLGIAYKEMGLMDEAIGEFQFAAKEPRMLVDCCSMLGICFREKGMAALAVKWYRRGLEAANSHDEDTVLGLRYDLAELLAEMGEHRQAMELFTEVFGINSKYRDVATRIRDLERQLAR